MSVTMGAILVHMKCPPPCLRRAAAPLLALLVLAAACGDDGSVMDADAGGCGSCDDGIFCNGLEVCLDGACVPGDPPCLSGTTCDEAADRCVTDCGADADADGDGVDSVDCGGTDCDDSDPGRFPGNTEVCDDAGIDEDCDPDTVGDRDADSDGYVDALCCNGTTCGDDCDDGVATVHPGEAESCNGADEDCDGMVDEGVVTTYVEDADRDGYGSDEPGAETRVGCQLPIGFAESADDCDDSVGSIHPGAFDACDDEAVDDDCSGTPNDPPGGCDCDNGATRGCPLPGLCGRGSQTCVDGTWAGCSILPGDEICGNGEDEDCDGAADDGCECESEVRFCGSDVGQCERGVQTCHGGDGSWGPCIGAVGPSPEICNELDDDCDGDVDEGVFFRCFTDTDGDGYSVVGAAVTEVCASGCPAGTTDRDPSDPANRDCAPDDDRAFPGQTRGWGDPRTDGGGYDFDCNGAETPTDAIVGSSCVADGSGMCLAPTSGLVSRQACGTRVTFIACGTIDNGSSGFTCEEVFRCDAGRTDCGDQNQTKCL